MVYKKKKQMLSFVIVFVLMVTVLPLSAFAATTTTLLDGNLSITDSVGTGTSSNGTVTITATGTTLYRQQNDIIFTNNLSKSATLTFNYTISGYDEHDFPADSGTYSTVLSAGGTVTQYIIAPRFKKTVTLTMSNFSLVEVADTSNVTVQYDSAYGVVTSGGTTVNDGDVKQGSLTQSIELTATVANGGTFLGWVNTEGGALLSTDAVYTCNPTKDLTVKAVFVGTNSDAWFYVGGATSAKESYGLLDMSTFTYYTVPTYTYLFDDLNDAATAAQNSTSKYVVLANSATLPADDYTIPSGVTLVIPFDGSNTTYTANPQWTGAVGTYTTPSAYRTLTMADGANLTIASGGAMSVPGKHTYAAGGTSCVPTGKVGMVKMNSGSTITVDGNLYAYGYIYGSGSVNVGSSGTVYELLQVYDCRGGTVTTNLNNDASTYGVFPFSQYRVQNIEVPTTYAVGGSLYTSLTMNMSSTDFCTGFQMIGSGSGFINMTSGTLTKQYDGSKDRTIFDVNGDVTLSAVSIEVNFVTISSSNFEFPFTNSWTINICSGNTTVNQDVSFLPGSEVYIAEDATATISSGKSVYIYDADQWGKFCYSSESGADVVYKPLKYSPTLTYTRSEADLVDAKVLVNGTLDASEGGIYTTAGGANIYSTGTGTVKTGATASGTTYQYSQISDDDGYGTEVYIDIAVTSAQLKHENGEYLGTAVSTTYNHDHYTCTADGDTTSDSTIAKCGEWYPGTHENKSSVVTNPTCTEKGYTTYTCTCEHSYTGDEIDALGHTAGDAVKENETATSYESVVYCSVCGEELSRETIKTTVYSVKITWEQTSTATYTPGSTTYTWLPESLKYEANTTEATWTGASVMTVTIDNTDSDGAVTATFGYTPTITSTMTGDALTVAAGEKNSRDLTVTPSGDPSSTDETIILGTITVTLTPN